VDLTRDRRVAKGAFDAATAKPTEEASTFTGMVAYAEVKQAAYSPYAHLSTFASAPYQAPSATAAAKVRGTSNAAGKLDKNESTVALGTHYNSWGTAYRPFTHVALSRGQVVDPDDATQAKALTRTDLVLGVIGKF
jgi:hypothetical protein